MEQGGTQNDLEKMVLIMNYLGSSKFPQLKMEIVIVNSEVFNRVLPFIEEEVKMGLTSNDVVTNITSISYLASRSCRAGTGGSV